MCERGVCGKNDGRRGRGGGSRLGGDLREGGLGDGDDVRVRVVVGEVGELLQEDALAGRVAPDLVPEGLEGRRRVEADVGDGVVGEVEDGVEDVRRDVVRREDVAERVEGLEGRDAAEVVALAREVGDAGEGDVLGPVGAELEGEELEVRRRGDADRLGGKRNIRRDFDAIGIERNELDERRGLASNSAKTTSMM